MSAIIKTDEKYLLWIQTVSARFKQHQLKAAVKVNSEMLEFYWSLGRDMESIKDSYAWGSHFYSQVSKDLRKALPDVKSFSPRNLLYMHQFYRLFPMAQLAGDEIAKQDVSQTGTQITKQPVSQLDEMHNIFLVPWGHTVQIINKCKDDQQKALFYVNKTVENNWSRAVLMNFLDTGLYEREGAAITNFQNTLPAVQGDLAQAITKDPYKFDFLTLRQDYDEKELKASLMDNIQQFLLELGSGFAFVGKEYRLQVGDTEQFLDMLFYNIKLHCYVVIEIKIRDFDPRDMGQLGTYVAAVDGLLKGEIENPTIGLLICKSKDNVLAQYSLNAVNTPIGISEYELSEFITNKYKGTMPTIEEIENELEEL